MVRRLWQHRARAGDAILGLACAATTAGPAMDSTLFGGSPYLHWHPSPPAAVSLGLLVGAGAVVRRRRPAVFAVIAITGWVLAAAYPAVVLAQYTVGASARSRRTLLILTTAATVAVAVPFRRDGLDAIIPLAVALCIAPTVLGMWVAALRERAARAERERLLLADQARAEERSRIAHDMHDVVTHRVSLMVLHATALQVAYPDEHRAIAARIGTIGREALDELRTLVGVLRTGTAPLLSLIHIDRGTPRPLPALVEHAAYRVVQEALTNVRKHAPGAAGTVLLRYETAALTVTVSNHGGSSASAASLPPGGHGLLGLRERVQLLGGRLTAGRTADGAFGVSATIPTPPEDHP